MKKDLLKISDLTKEDIEKIIDLAFQFKDGQNKSLNDKSIAMIFEKPSLRTKVAFEIAANKLQATPIFLSSGQIFASGNNQKGRESIPDIAKNLERFTDLILARVYNHQTLETIASSTDKPVINALCDKHHPTQALADLMAIKWHKPNQKDLKVAFIGDGNNVATSLMQICAIMGINFTIASPTAYHIDTAEYEIALKHSTKSGATIEITEDPKQAVKNADIIYTDTFISMGQEDQKQQKLKDFQNYQVNLNLFNHAKSDALFMHCLPAHRGEEVTDQVMDHPNSIIFDQAECRMHIAKSLLSLYLS